MTREEIEGLNAILVRVGYKILALHEAAFLDRLPRRGRPQAEEARGPVDPKALADLEGRLLKLATTQKPGTRLCL